MFLIILVVNNIFVGSKVYRCCEMDFSINIIQCMVSVLYPIMVERSDNISPRIEIFAHAIVASLRVNLVNLKNLARPTYILLYTQCP